MGLSAGSPGVAPEVEVDVEGFFSAELWGGSAGLVADELDVEMVARAAGATPDVLPALPALTMSEMYAIHPTIRTLWRP